LRGQPVELGDQPVGRGGSGELLFFSTTSASPRGPSYADSGLRSRKPTNRERRSASTEDISEFYPDWVSWRVVPLVLCFPPICHGQEENTSWRPHMAVSGG
jgi:hypothetical protein